jgi:hypothetical protein
MRGNRREIEKLVKICFAICDDEIFVDCTINSEHRGAK